MAAARELRRELVLLAVEAAVCRIRNAQVALRLLCRLQPTGRRNDRFVIVQVRAVLVTALNAREVLGGVRWVAQADACVLGAPGAEGRWRGGARAIGSADLAVAHVAEENVRVGVVPATWHQRRLLVRGGKSLVAPADRTAPRTACKVGRALFDKRGVAGSLVARTTERPGFGRGVRVGGIEPDHAHLVVVPQGEDCGARLEPGVLRVSTQAGHRGQQRHKQGTEGSNHTSRAQRAAATRPIKFGGSSPTDAPRAISRRIASPIPFTPPDLLKTS